MYIKSIVLDGFKSYGQRTEITGFDQQFNAITGLNGSGKSNILDAICFLLGITNLSHVRANSFQELIYRNGAAGINKATVSITFDNSNPAQCPPGFEEYDELTITRQIVMGGKNKYLINGSNVPNKKVQDLFCSIQLNVNNPNFLIMQGKITKVLNMKAQEILSMVEEAAGTRMYEVKRQTTQKTIEKKDAKVQELRAILTEDISPKLEKLRQERAKYLEYQVVERELEHMMAIYEIWLYFDAKRDLTEAEKAQEKGNADVQAVEDKVERNKEKIVEINENIKDIINNKDNEEAAKLQLIENQLSEKEKEEAKAKASNKAVHDQIIAEEKKKKQLEKNITEDEKALAKKEDELNKVKNYFETLKANDAKDNEALAMAQKKFEALSAGMEVNEDGEAETLQEQLMNAKQAAVAADTQMKEASMQLAFCQDQLKEKQKSAKSCNDYNTDKAKVEKLQAEVDSLENNLKKINYSEEKANELLDRKRALNDEVRRKQDVVENFRSQRPYTHFAYQDPEPNFNKNRIKGVACKLFDSVDDCYCTALEVAAGGRLYNVVVDTDETSKKLLQRGKLQQRTTFIPLNKIQCHKIPDNVTKFAQDLVGRENCKPALSLIKYDNRLQSAMEFIFGSVFICSDINVASKVAFHKNILKRCVTLDGDIVDPAGTLSGGARQKSESVLIQLKQIKLLEAQLQEKENEKRQIEQEINTLSVHQEKYTSLKRNLELKSHELRIIQQRLQTTEFHIQQEEINNLKLQIDELNTKIKASKAKAVEFNKKAHDVEIKMKDSKNYKEKQLKQAEIDLKNLKEKAEKSSKEWNQKQDQYETLILEITELKNGIENAKQQIQSIDNLIISLKDKYEGLLSGSSQINTEIKDLQNQVKKAKAEIESKNKEIQAMTNKKEALKAEIDEFQLKLREYSHETKKLSENVKNCKHRVQELSKKIDKGSIHFEKAQNLSHAEGMDLQRKIKNVKEKKDKLGRTVNAKAQRMFEHEEKQYNELKKKESIVMADRRKLETILADLDKKKKNSLKLAHEQVSKDFGSIFSTLLPGANAKLVPPPNKTILEGLEIKVSLGGVWKDSLTELSGGQRSLAALSLILAMLLFKPAPLYILDEVDAALDLSHTQNIGSMLKSHFKKSQFIIVSLKDGMFNNANVLFKTKFVDGHSTITRSVNMLK